MGTTLNDVGAVGLIGMPPPLLQPHESNEIRPKIRMRIDTQANSATSVPCLRHQIDKSGAPSRIRCSSFGLAVSPESRAMRHHAIDSVSGSDPESDFEVRYSC